MLAPTVMFVADAGTDAHGDGHPMHVASREDGKTTRSGCDEMRATVRRRPAEELHPTRLVPSFPNSFGLLWQHQSHDRGDETGLTVAPRADRRGFQAWSDPASATTFRVGGGNDGFLPERTVDLESSPTVRTGNRTSMDTSAWPWASVGLPAAPWHEPFGSVTPPGLQRSRLSAWKISKEQFL